MKLKEMKIGQSVVAATKSPFDAGAKVANEGHYLERLLGLAKVFKLEKERIALIDAALKFVLSSHKPQWIDGLVDEFSGTIINRALELNPTDEDWAKIVYGLSDSAFESYDLDPVPFKEIALGRPKKEDKAKKKGDKEASDSTEAEWGFDLTDISAANWKKVLAAGGISPKPVNDDGKWVWTGPKIKIHTGNDPITGKYGRAGGREDEKNYASYIGVYGDKEIVKKVAKLISTLADSIKEETPNKSRFI